MEQYETNIATVMDFLKDNDFSPSVISLHKLCYQELKGYLLSLSLNYSTELAYQWIESNQSDWNYRTYTGWRHCIDQLEDVYSMGYISLDHLSCRTPAYALLNDSFKSMIDAFISDYSISDDRYRIACSRFLLYLQNNSLNNISELDYNVVLQFHQKDYHCSSKSKDVYEDLIRVFLRYLAVQGMCSFGLSLALNRLLIYQIIKLSDEELNSYTTTNQKYPSVTWSIILEFLTKMADARYGKTVLKSSKHILTLLYIFLDMHQICLDDTLLWYWFDKITPLLGTGWKQHRRTICQFLDFLRNNTITTKVTGKPKGVKAIHLLPNWEAEQLKSYLNLLKREGWQPSTIAMYRSSNLRFCKYLQRLGIEGFSSLTTTILKDFNLQDKHVTPEGKAAYNCRIRNFLIYLYEQSLIDDPYLYKALPTFSAPRTSIIQTLSKEDVASIWATNPDTLSPKALRDYAMVCIGLTMGFRASDISALRFENIDWKQRSIKIVQQKTGKVLTMPMPIKTGNIVFRYIRDGRPQSPEPYIFIRHEAPYNRIQRGVCRSALKRFIAASDDKSCCFHSVRKTFATQLLKGNTKVELISDSLGHSTDGTVHKYLSLDEKQMRMCPLSMVDTGIAYKGGVFHA
ncbi:tyrosine-type recombinase/integrase [Anaerocolumna sp. AGMB13025]|uniref:tyrosine-type recombinase/integrase n=1 Tax=Anaerocolumna sp. AGMB13025 TaxID=3039116 RepID=UPI00241FD1F3|nr:tyrosine-type recombinase/integrase [Anaerocolumna sp. AGMB13025]WFR57127.1 tyrosine-type recombinase/integrase [Anaerocolumna sp. AGMB13025]